MPFGFGQIVPVAAIRAIALKVPAAQVGRLLAYFAGLAEDRKLPEPRRRLRVCLRRLTQIGGKPYCRNRLRQ